MAAMIVHAGLAAAVPPPGPAAKPAPQAGPTKPAPEALPLATVEIDRPLGVAFSPDGMLLVAAGPEGILEIDPERIDRRRVLVPGAADRSFTAVASLPDGAFVALESLAPSLERFRRDGSAWPLPAEAAGPQADGRPLRRPGGIALSSDGSEIAVADTGNDRVVRLGLASPIEPRSLGAGGDPDARLRAPAGVAFDPAGRLFVADADRHRIVRFGRDGRFETAFGTRGANPGQLERPLALIADDGSLLVADHYNHRVQRFAEDGDFRTLWGMHAVIPREGDGRIHYPVAIASDPARGRFAVAEPFERRVQIFRRSREGERVPIGPPPPAREGVSSHFGEGIAVDGTLLAAWEPEASAVVVFDLRGERPVHVTTFGSAGRRPQEIGRVAGIAADEASERIWILDAGQRRLVEWSLRRDPAGELRFEPFMARVVRSIDFEAIARSLPAAPDGSADFDPIAIAHAPGGLLLLDRARRQVLRLDDASWRPVGALRNADMGFPRDPIAMAIDPPARRAAILDGRDPQRLAAIVPLGPEGDTRVVPRPPGLVDPQSIAWLGEDRLVVTCGDDRFFILDLDGGARASPPLRGIEDGRLWHPRGVAGAADGSFFLVDWGNHRLQRFDRDGAWLARFGIGRSALRPRMPDAVPPVLRPKPGSAAPAPAPPVGPRGPWPRRIERVGGVLQWRPVSADGAALESIPLRDPFFVRIEPLGEDFGSTALSVDAAMPHHGHGMNLVPAVRADERGGWRAGPLLFQMPGAWEIYFDFERDGVTRRVQDEVIMEESK